MAVLTLVLLEMAAIALREIAFIVVPFIVRLDVYWLLIALPDGNITPLNLS